MMRMLKFLRLVVCVVCIAAFASGCGGGGGGAGTTDPSTTPEQTDEQKIAAAQDTIAGIVTNASSLAQAASSAAAAVQASEDATAEQIASALAHAGDAQAALADVLAASGAGNAATTPAQAETAVADANAALNNLRTAQSAVAGIQNAVNAVAEARMQREADETALTNNSSLIRHVRVNKLLSDALLDDLVSAEGGNARILVGAVGNGAAGEANNGVATYPADSVTGGVRNVGQRTVQMQGLTSNSTTPTLTGTGRLPHGFDLNDGTTIFVDAYTDITKTANRSGDNPRTTDEEDGYQIPDPDYLLAGIWLSVGANIAGSEIRAFAYGNQPITNAYLIDGAEANVCTNAEGTDAADGTHTRVCTNPAGFDLISRFVQDGRDITATYRGDANGIYIAGGETSYFTADVELTAEFQNPTSADTAAADGTGSIQGAVSNITAGGQQIEGDIELQKLSLGTTGDRNNISPAFTGEAVGVIEGKIYTGGWRGQFFGMRYRREPQVYTPAVSAQDGTITTPQNTATTYSPQHPGSVAGTFQVIKQSAPVGDAAFIGSFAAER